MGLFCASHGEVGPEAKIWPYLRKSGKGTLFFACYKVMRMDKGATIQGIPEIFQGRHLLEPSVNVGEALACYKVLRMEKGLRQLRAAWRDGSREKSARTFQSLLSMWEAECSEGDHDLSVSQGYSAS